MENLEQTETTPTTDGKFDDSENITSEIMLKILAYEGNNLCFDCGTDSNQWASVNNGILLCLKCVDSHKKLGSHISLIKSTTVDKWEPSELNYLQIGGNKRLQEYFDKYNLKKELAIHTKYKTKAAFYYREELKGMVEGGPHFLELDENEAVDIIELEAWEDYKKDALAANKNDEKSNQQSGSNKIFGILGNAFAKTTEATKNVVHKINDKIHDPNLQENLKKFGSSVVIKTATLGHQTVEITKKGVDTVKQAAHSVNEKVHDPKIQNDVKQFGSSVLNKSKDIGKTSVEIGQKGFESVKSGLFSAYKFFAKSAGVDTEKNIEYEEEEEEKDAASSKKATGLNSNMMTNEMKH